MGPVMNAGLNGMHTSYQKMTQSAHQIAREGQPVSKEGSPENASADSLHEGLTAPLVEMKQQQHIFTASAKVVSVASETLGSLIDEHL